MLFRLYITYRFTFLYLKIFVKHLWNVGKEALQVRLYKLAARTVWVYPLRLVVRRVEPPLVHCENTVEMSKLFEIVRECIVAASNANPAIDREFYTRALTPVNNERNYIAFYMCAASCSSGLLAMLYACGFFKEDERLLEIAVDVVTARDMIGENYEDVNGLVKSMLNRER